MRVPHPTCVPLGTLQNAVGGRCAGSVLQFPDALRRRHCLCTGLSGYGKSFWLNGLIGADIDRGAPVFLVDGVGASFEGALNHIAARAASFGLQETRMSPGIRSVSAAWCHQWLSRFVLVDVTKSQEWRFNPIEVVPGLLSPEDVVAETLSCFERITEGDLENMRRLLMVLGSILSLLAELNSHLNPLGQGTTLRDAVDFLELEANDIHEFVKRLRRKRALGHLRVPVRDDVAMKWLSSVFANIPSKKQRLELTASTHHALNLLLSDASVAQFISAPVGNLPICDVLSGGKSLFARLPPVGLMTSKVVGSMLINRLTSLAARRRPADVISGKEPLVTLYVDEVQNFATKRFSEEMAFLRNYGVAVIASHQHSLQSPWHTQEGSALYRAMRENMATRVVFRLGLDNAQEVAPAVFRPRGDMIQREETEVTETEGHGSSRGSSESTSTSTTMSSGTSMSYGTTSGGTYGSTHALDGETGSSSWGGNSSSQWQDGSSESHGSSSGRAASQSHQQSEQRSTSVRKRRDYYSVDDQGKIHAFELASLPPRVAYVWINGERSDAFRIRTLDVPLNPVTRIAGTDYLQVVLRAGSSPSPPMRQPSRGFDERFRGLFELLEKRP